MILLKTTAPDIEILKPPNHPTTQTTQKILWVKDPATAIGNRLRGSNSKKKTAKKLCFSYTLFMSNRWTGCRSVAVVVASGC